MPEPERAGSQMHLIRVRQRVRMPQVAPPAMLLAGVALLAAAVTTSATVVHLDAAAGGAARAAGLPVDLGFAMSLLGSTDVVLPVTLAAVLVLILLRHWRGALTLTLAVFATQAACSVIKLAVERPRPALNGAVSDASGFSFPSAHSATAVAVYATLALVLVRGCRAPAARAAVVALAAGLVAAIGLSRVLLAAHYPIDVLAGWLTGGALVAASWLLVRRLTEARPRALPAP
jgi:membrane-associated phospholipid phosphatase